MKRAFFLFIFAALIACSNDSNVKPAGVINVSIGEFISPNGFRLSLQFETGMKYQCYNFQLNKTEAVGENYIDVAFNGVTDPGVCLTAIGPAHASVDLENLSSGSYALMFANMGSVSNGLLVLTENEISVNLSPGKSFVLTRNKVKRLKKGTYFGTIGYHKESSLADVDAFIEQVKNIDGVVSVNEQDPGPYTYFEIDDDGKMIVDQENSGYYFVKGLIFQYGGDDEDAFRDEIDSIATTYVEKMNVYLESYSGRKVANYTDHDGD